MALVAWWPLNNDFRDYSGNNYHLSNQNISISNGGKIGNCCAFNGVANQKLYRQSFPENGKEFTWSCWVYQTGETTTRQFILSQGRDVVPYGINISNINNQINIFIGGNNLLTLTYSLLNKWTHIALCGKDGKGKLYLNGEMKLEFSYSEILFTNSQNAFVIGKMAHNFTSDSTYFPFKGKINDVRVYNHFLSVKEIKEIYRTKVLHYNFNNQFEEPTVNIKNSVSYSTAEKGSNYFVKKETDSWYQGVSLPSTTVTPGKTYTWSFEVKSDMEFSHHWDANCTANNYTGNDAAMGTTAKPQTTGKYTNIGKWQQVFLTVTVNADAVSPYLHHAYCPPAISRSNIKIYTRNHQLEEKDHVTLHTKGTRNLKIGDSSGYRNHGTIIASNSPAWVKETNIGCGSFKFNGSNKISLTSNFLNKESQEWSVCAWLKLNANNITQTLVNLNQGCQITLSETTKAINYINNGANDWYKYSSGTIPTNQWIHLAFTFNQQNDIVRIYLNGTNVTGTGPNKESTKVPVGIPSTIEFFNSFNGLCSDLRIYATQLADSDIKELYNVKAAVSKNGKFFINEISEKFDYAYLMNEAIKNKTFTNGVYEYVQSHCQVTLTDQGVRIYRTPNLNVDTDGRVMWGGLKLQFPEGTFRKGGKYKFSAMVCGKTSNAITTPALTPQMGWAAGGLTEFNGRVISGIPANFNSQEYKKMEVIFDLTNFNTIQTATKTESIFTAGQRYNCCRDLTVGFGYTNTGTLGTDIYIKDISLVEITDSEKCDVDKYSVLNVNAIHEIESFETMNELGATWVKMYYHNSKDGTVLWGNHNEFLRCSTIDKYSNLWALEQFRGRDGKFELLMKCSGATGYNRWKQTNNFTNASSQSGYQAIACSWTTHGWAGLEGTPNGDNAHADGIAGSTWWYSIGPRVKFETGMPCPNTATGGTCEIWVRYDNCNNFKIYKDGIVESTEFIEI